MWLKIFLWFSESFTFYSNCFFIWKAQCGSQAGLPQNSVLLDDNLRKCHFSKVQKYWRHRTHFSLLEADFKLHLLKFHSWICLSCWKRMNIDSYFIFWNVDVDWVDWDFEKYLLISEEMRYAKFSMFEQVWKRFSKFAKTLQFL